MPLVTMPGMLYHTYDNNYAVAAFLKRQFIPDASDLISIDYQEKISRVQQ